jgi:hypothetical protein
MCPSCVLHVLHGIIMFPIILILMLTLMLILMLNPHV